MNLNTLKDLYYNSPAWIKNIYSKIPYRIRNGATYREWNNFLKQEFNNEYPLLKLRETLFLAQQEVPYYQKQYSGLGLVGLELKNLKDICQLPFIDKRIVSENYKDFINTKSKKSFYVSTGGSSGEPMKFLQSKNVWSKELAFINSIFSQIEYKPSFLKASFRGAQFAKLKKNTYWHFNPIQNEIQFSPFHLSPLTISAYIATINSNQPSFIHGYPSAILNFIHLSINSGLRLTVRIKGIVLISENYDKNDIIIIKKFFNCPVLSFYGHSERLIISPTIDELCQVYEVDQRYGFFELISRNNNTINEANERGEITGTSFDNYSMPLIRYKTGDYTHLLTTSKRDAIHFSPVEGRWKNEFIEGKNGEQLSLTAINFHSNQFDNIVSYQFLQERAGYCELLLTANSKIEAIQIEDISKIVNLKIGHAVKLSVRQIGSPILTNRGKQLKFIKQINN